MTFLGEITVGILLIITGFLAAKIYHEWWLSDREWNGNIFGSSRPVDRAIGWLPFIGLILIVGAVFWKVLALLAALV